MKRLVDAYASLKRRPGVMLALAVYNIAGSVASLLGVLHEARANYFPGVMLWWFYTVVNIAFGFLTARAWWKFRKAKEKK